MVALRIIPCLDIKDGRVVKGVRFGDLRDAGDPVEAARRYEEQGGDELVLLDVSASPEGRAHAVETVAAVREHLSIPVTAGGGVRSVDDAYRLLEAGADKVAVNTAAVGRPRLVKELAERFGSQCTVVSVDAGRYPAGWHVIVGSGRIWTGIEVVDWCREAVALGCGEILLTSWDRDGTKEGYDLGLIESVASAIGVPVVASGGAHTPEDLVAAFGAGATAALVASILHDGETTVQELKVEMERHGLEVRR